MSATPRITKVYSFASGMVMVFDQYGEQMPEYQGRRAAVADKIRRDAPDVEWSEENWG